MTPSWSRSLDGGWRWQLDRGRVLEIIPKATGWAIRLTEGSTVVRMSWPFQYYAEARAKAEEFAFELGWLSELPRP